ncbi:hypothetical protein DHD05_13280 [Arenibacter sp. N53]|nr:hypothetical protein [Arenibacter sp. N53]
MTMGDIALWNELKNKKMEVRFGRQIVNTYLYFHTSPKGLYLVILVQ